MEWFTKFDLGYCCQILLGAQPLTYWPSLHCLCLFLLLDSSLDSQKKGRRRKKKEKRKLQHTCVLHHTWKGFFFSVLDLLCFGLCLSGTSVRIIVSAKWINANGLLSPRLQSVATEGLIYHLYPERQLHSVEMQRYSFLRLKNPPHISRLAQMHHGLNMDLEYESGPTTQLHLSKI